MSILGKLSPSSIRRWSPSKGSDFESKSLGQYVSLINEEEFEENNKVKDFLHFEPLFVYSEFEVIKNLEKNRLISNYEITNETNIKCTIYVKKDLLPMVPLNRYGKIKTSLFYKILTLLWSKNGAKCRNKSLDHTDIIQFGEGYFAWSIDCWKTWTTIKADYLMQSKRFLIYEALLSNAESLVPPDEKIEFVSCFINDNYMLKDDNCYAFQRVDKRIKLGH